MNVSRLALLTAVALAATPVAVFAQSPWPSQNPPAASNPSPFDGPPARNAGPERGPSPFDPPSSPQQAAPPPAPSAFDRAPPQAARPQGPSPFDQPAGGMAGGQQEMPPCIKTFLTLRTETEKRGKAIQEAGAKKVSPQQACGLFNAFVSADEKMIKYAEANVQSCGIPAQVVADMKKGHLNAMNIRTRVCNAAKAQEQGPLGPSLGDALGATPVPNSNNVKPGRGTFDTLTGTPLGNTR